MRFKDLINLPVFTQSGQKLGQISEVEIDPMTGQILKYFIKSNNLIKKFLEKELIINRSQVISLSQEKMVVEDSVIKEKGRVLQTAQI